MATTKIEPTIGRVLWFWPENGRYGNRLLQSKVPQPFSVSVCFVNDDGTINVGGFDHCGQPFHEFNVPVIQDGDPRPEVSFCEWMPYQKGQAAKADALAAQQAAAKA